MIYLLLTIIFVAIGVYVVKNTSKKDTAEQEQQQPIHFDLLDDNGEPIKQQPSVRVRVQNTIDEPKVKNLRYFSVKDKGYHVSVWPKDSNNWLPGFDYVEFNIAGLTHRDNIDKYLGEHVGKLEAEPTNQYDPNAIKVLAHGSNHVGYVPKDMTQQIRNFTSLPCKCYFYIGENSDEEGSHFFSSCYITTPDVSPCQK